MEGGIKIPEKLLNTLQKNNQMHLLSYLNYIDTEENKMRYLKDLEDTDYDFSSKLYEFSKNEHIETKYTVDKFSPIPYQYSIDSIEKNKEEYIKKGYELIYQGKVATLILAGGLGTRLGLDKPKGVYNIQMPSNKTLFEYLSNRFLISQLESKEKVKNDNLQFKESTLFIMTNVETNKFIEDFFKENNYFHIKKENVICFPQNEVCTLGLDGKINNISPSKLYKCPDGNGGCFTAIKQNNILKICAERNIEFINVCAVDNTLTGIMDPLFIGLTIEKGKKGLKQMSAKYLQKKENEKIGNFLIFENSPMMLDYMEVPEELRNVKNDKGELVYGACNILNYLIGVEFLKEILIDSPEKYEQLIKKFHILKKKLDVYIVDEKEKKVNLVKNYPSLKFEIFFNSIFEFASADGFLLMEVLREKEFLPIKNKDDAPTDSPLLARNRLNANFREDYIKVGGKIINDSPDKILEFSMLINFKGENNESFFKKYPYIPKEIDMSKGNLYFKNEEIEK